MRNNRVAYLAWTSILCAFGGTEAFAPPRPASPAAKASMTALRMADGDQRKNPIAGIVGAFGIAAAVLASGAVASDAYEYVPPVGLPPAQEAVGKLGQSV